MALIKFPEMTNQEDHHPVRSDLEQKLLGLIETSGVNLTDLAEEAGVPYQPVQRWVRGDTEKLHVGHAEKLYSYLTGESLG